MTTVSENEAARILGMNRGTLRNWRLGGYLPEGMVLHDEHRTATRPIRYSREVVERLASSADLENELIGFYRDLALTHPSEMETPASGAAEAGALGSREGTESDPTSREGQG